MVLVVGADPELVAEALERCGGSDDLFALDPSPELLERLEKTVRDPRIWYLIGDAEVIPLPDRFVDATLGVEWSAEIERVCRGNR